ncbi:MAG: zinc-binding dehydrogenase [Jatrophihabitans sp.]
MRVVEVSEFGPSGVLVTRDAPDPVAGPGEVVVDVAAADVLWVHTMIRSGNAGSYFDVAPPYVPGDAVAGRVRTVGAGVDESWVGRSVVARTSGGGGYAERAVVSADGLLVIPDGVSFTNAASLLADGNTAMALLDLTGVKAGDAVLVVGSSGGLGILLIQLATSRGARVVAVARDEAKLARIRLLGAAAVIDSEQPDWVAQARAALGGAGAEVILDNVGGAIGEAAFELIAPGGHVSAHGTPSGRFAEIDAAEVQRRGVTLTGIRDVQLTPADRTRFTAEALAETAAGRLVPIIGQTFPLERAAEAHAAIEARTVFGKTLLVI